MKIKKGMLVFNKYDYHSNSNNQIIPCYFFIDFVIEERDGVCTELSFEVQGKDLTLDFYSSDENFNEEEDTIDEEEGSHTIIKIYYNGKRINEN